MGVEVFGEVLRPSVKVNEPSRTAVDDSGYLSPGPGLRVLYRVSESWTGSQSPGQGLRVLDRVLESCCRCVINTTTSW